MRVEALEVQPAGDEEDDRPDGGRPIEAAGSPLGGLEQAVDGFQESVGLTGLRPGHDALQMAAHKRGNLLHRVDLGAHDADVPVLDRGAHDVDLFSVQDLAQLLLVDPVTGRAREPGGGDERVQRGTGLGLEAEGVLEQRSAHALDGGVAALFDAARLLHSQVGVRDDVELVEGDARIG